MRMCLPYGRRALACVVLAEQAKILVAEAKENNLGRRWVYAEWNRWHTCSLCEQDTTASCCARDGRAGRRTWGGRRTRLKSVAMTELGNGLRSKPTRGRVVRERGRVVCGGGARAHQKKIILSVQNNLATMNFLDGLMKACACDETYALEL